MLTTSLTISADAVRSFLKYSQLLTLIWLQKLCACWSFCTGI